MPRLTRPSTSPLSTRWTGATRSTSSEPGESVSLRVTLRRDGDEPFVATLRGQRRAVTAANVLRATLRYPSARTSALIRWQGIRLWWKGLEVQPR